MHIIDVMEKRIGEFVRVLEKNNGFAAATEGRLKPFSDWDLKAYVTAHLRWIWKDSPIEPVSKYSLEFEQVAGAIAVAEFRVHDAAVVWVWEKFGTQAAGELDRALDDHDQVMALWRKRDELDQ